ncbi:MAG: T9SS type A sorting domain-containing protein, partial [Candidatus Cloacimonadota bacterium]|nr:T9SS type A sorting domain-containing protein [Candidatus Cloacimonadota bacterium]
TLDGTILENENYSLNVNSSPSSISCWIYAGGNLVDDSGIIVNLEFGVNASAPIGDVAELLFTEAIVNEQDVNSSDGQIEILGGYNISGNVFYYEDDSPISNASVILTNQRETVLTNTQGEYQFSLIVSGNYISQVEKTDELGGLSSMDASRIARYGIGLISLEPCRIIAADVTQNSYVNPTDASRVARYGIGLIENLNDGGNNWVFVADSLNFAVWPPIYYDSQKEYTPLNSDLSAENFCGIRLGDVTGNWSSSERFCRKGTRDITASLPDTSTANGNISIPLSVQNLIDLEGMDIAIEFSENIVSVTNVSLVGGILEQEDFVLEFNSNTDGLIAISLYSIGQLFTGSGNILNIQFNIVGQSGESTALSFTQFDVNEIDYLSGTTNGSIYLEQNAAGGSNIENLFTELKYNFPNPFCEVTNISYSLAKSDWVTIKIYNLQGRLVETLIADHQDEGKYSVNLIAAEYPAGIYFYRMQTSNFEDTKKMLLIK